VRWQLQDPDSVEIVCRAVTAIDVTRRQPCGPSDQVNTVTIHGHTLELEMQSGDLISVDAAEIIQP
jgi:hypothetical protein